MHDLLYCRKGRFINCEHQLTSLTIVFPPAKQLPKSECVLKFQSTQLGHPSFLFLIIGIKSRNPNDYLSVSRRVVHRMQIILDPDVLLLPKLTFGLAYQLNKEVNSTHIKPINLSYCLISLFACCISKSD